MDYFEIDLTVDAQVKDKRLATHEDEAIQFSRDAVERAIASGLRSELSGGESSVNVSVVSVREANEDF